MDYLYNSELNAKDLHISKIIEENIEKIDEITISKLAELSGVSPSKITKYADKLGFNGFKQLHFQLKTDKNSINEVNSVVKTEKKKLDKFFHDFSQENLNLVVDEIQKADKIYLFGRGPSLKVCEYFNPRLRVAAGKNIITNYDEYLFDLDLKKNEESKLMIILTVSGKNNKVHDILKICQENNIKTICISAYRNSLLKKESTHHITLINQKEVFDPALFKGRTLFYLYLEILTQEFLARGHINYEK